jgi:hypothetical protein
MTVADLDARMGSAELTEWMAYERMTGPLGRRRQDIQAATIAAAIANASRGKRGKTFTVADFLLPYGERTEKTPEEILRIFEGMGGETRGSRRHD